MSTMLKKVSKVTHKIQNYVLSGSVALSICMAGMVVYAAPTEGTAIAGMVEAVKTLGKIVCVPGLLFLIFGLVHYAEARSEGDGPAKNKAMQQVSAGIMVLLIGVILWTTGMESLIKLFFA